MEGFLDGRSITDKVMRVTDYDTNVGRNRKLWRPLALGKDAFWKNKCKPNLEGFWCQTQVDFALRFEKVFEQVHDSSRAVSWCNWLQQRPPEEGWFSSLEQVSYLCWVIGQVIGSDVTGFWRSPRASVPFIFSARSGTQGRADDHKWNPPVWTFYAYY